MKAEALSKFPHIWLTCLGLLLFFGVFMGALAWVFRRGSVDFYAKLSASPLENPQEKVS